MGRGSGKAPTCRLCNSQLSGEDRNVCHVCSVKFCGLCHGGFYNSEDEPVKQTKLVTNRHIHAETKRRQLDELLAKHEQETGNTGGVEGSGGGRSVQGSQAPRLSRGVAVAVKRKRKPVNITVEVSEDDENAVDPDDILGFWRGSETEYTVKVPARPVKREGSIEEESIKQESPGPKRKDQRKRLQVYVDAHDTQEPTGNESTRALMSKSDNILGSNNSNRNSAARGFPKTNGKKSCPSLPRRL